MGGLGDGGDFGGGGRDVPLGPAAVDPDVRAADSGASGLPGREEIAEAEPQAVDFSVGGAEDSDLQRVILVGHAAGDEFQPGAAAAAEGNEAGTACAEGLAGFKSGGLAGETAEFLFEEIQGDASLISKILRASRDARGVSTRSHRAIVRRGRISEQAPDEPL